jgi:GT2 family glycosyltransferase
VEIWVVDNASADGTINYLSPRFPNARFIANSLNVGFSKANNQALKQCTGQYILFLNPDTILAEDTLNKSILFYEQQQNIGGLGIRMIDGSGNFLPESKRSFPTPMTSLFKLSGLSKVFSRSKIFSKYSLAYLNQHHNHEVDVLAGAFLMCRRDLLDELNGFDETFFMYGEDIDLSYRIQKKGFKNYYFGESTIIHFKGESTRKGSLNYVKMFYQTMSIFVKKHYKGTLATLFAFFIHVAIWFRASITAFLQAIVKIGLPLVDALLIYTSFKIVTYSWIMFLRDGKEFSTSVVNISLPAFTILFITAATLGGIYDRRYRPLKALYAALTAIVVILAAYSLLAETLRFSRGVILFGGLTAAIVVVAFRQLLLQLGIVEITDEQQRHHQTLVVGTEDEFLEVKNLFVRAGLEERLMGRIAVNGTKDNAISTLEELQLTVNTLQIREIIFCNGYLQNERIIELLQKIPPTISAKFHANGTGSIVGSDSKNKSGEILSAESTFNINDPYERRMKRFLDISFSLILLLTFPVHLILVGLQALRNAFFVLFGKKTWIGYTTHHRNLPVLRKAIIQIGRASEKFSASVSNQTADQLDFWYAKNYDWKQDFKLLLKNYDKLGNL